MGARLIGRPPDFGSGTVEVRVLRPQPTLRTTRPDATSRCGVDQLRNQFNTGRTEMIAAFVGLSDLARRHGVDEDTITALHGRFFDGNVTVKTRWRVLLLIAEMRRRSVVPQ